MIQILIEEFLSFGKFLYHVHEHVVVISECIQVSLHCEPIGLGKGRILELFFVGVLVDLGFFQHFDEDEAVVDAVGDHVEDVL